MKQDPQRLRSALSYLLLHRPDQGELVVGKGGWVSLPAAARALGRLLRTRLGPGELRRLLESGGGSPPWLELRGSRLRARGRLRVPEILYLPTSLAAAERARREGRVRARGDRPVLLHQREHQAWLDAHRRRSGLPEVLYVDAGRARRAGVTFYRVGQGRFGVDELPARFALNLQPRFGFQPSAGGFLLRAGPSGWEVGLVRVRRGRRLDWEVAKGKLELGETPRETALRELDEEMGLEGVPLEVLADLGTSHYAFNTPAGEPRLKVLYLFVLRPLGPLPSSFHTAEREGIEAVAFFTPEELPRVVTHGSLREPIRRLRAWLERWEPPPHRSSAAEE